MDTIKPRRIEVIDDTMAAVWRSKSGAEKLHIADQMYRFARDTIMASLSRQHPDWDPETLARQTARRMSHGAV